MSEVKPHLGARTWLHSLRFQLMLWYTGVLALLLVVAGILFYTGIQSALRTEADGFLASEAHRIVQILSDAPAGEIDSKYLPQEFLSGHLAERAGRDSDPRWAQVGGQRLLPFDTVYARLVRGPGLPTFQSADLAAQPALANSLSPPLRRTIPVGGRFDFAGPDEERMMRVLTLRTQMGRDPALLQLAVPWDHNADAVEYLGRALAGGLLVVLLCAAAGGWTLVGRTLRPIGRIVAEADSLNAEALPEVLLPRAGESDSEIGLLVATLNRMTQRLHKAFEMQRRFAEAQQRFAADASHELRTPLTVLRGELDLALTRPREAAVYQATLASAIEEVARMSRIVEGLSFLARQDAGQIGPIRCEQVELTTLCQDVAEDARPAALQKNIHLHVEGDPALSAAGDPDQLRVLLGNLLGNALKYTPPGGHITLDARRSADGSPIIAVSDSGIGISPQDLPYVFDRFWRADQSRASEGSGLGLPISRAVAEAHGGTLTAASQPGRGSVFTLRLGGPLQPC